MSQLPITIIASWSAGLAAFGGGVIAWATDGSNTDTKREVTHGIIAFGGGILIAAVAFALLPKAMVALTPVGLGTTSVSVQRSAVSDQPKTGNWRSPMQPSNARGREPVQSVASRAAKRPRGS